MNLLESIDRLITERGSAAVLDKHNAFLKTQLESIRERVVELEKENSNLKAEIANLANSKNRPESSDSQLDKWPEIEGACFKPLAIGGYEKSPRCPICHSVLSTVMPNPRVPYECSNKTCGYKIYFQHGLESVVAQLSDL